MPKATTNAESTEVADSAAIRQRALQAGRRILDAKEGQADRHQIRRDQIAVTRADLRQAEGAPTLSEIHAAFGTWAAFLDRLGLSSVELSEQTRGDLQRARQVTLRRRNRQWPEARAEASLPTNELGDESPPYAQTSSLAPKEATNPTTAATEVPPAVPTPPRSRSPQAKRAPKRTPKPKPVRTRPEWNANLIAEAIKTWIDEHDGQIPKSTDFRAGNGLPGITTVERYCGNAGTAIKLAGYEMSRSSALRDPGIGL